MSKGYALLEVLISAMVIACGVNLIFTAIADFPQRVTSILSSPWNSLKEGCDYACVLAADSP